MNSKVLTLQHGVLTVELYLLSDVVIAWHVALHRTVTQITLVANITNTTPEVTLAPLSQSEAGSSLSRLGDFSLQVSPSPER